MEQTAHESTDPTRIYQLMLSINNMGITSKIPNSERNAPRSLQKAFEKTLSLDAILQLVNSIQMGCSY